MIPARAGRARLSKRMRAAWRKAIAAVAPASHQLGLIAALGRFAVVRRHFMELVRFEAALVMDQHETERSTGKKKKTDRCHFWSALSESHAGSPSGRCVSLALAGMTPSFFLPLERLLAVFVPADVELALELVDPLLRARGAASASHRARRTGRTAGPGRCS